MKVKVQATHLHYLNLMYNQIRIHYSNSFGSAESYRLIFCDLRYEYSMYKINVANVYQDIHGAKCSFIISSVDLILLNRSANTSHMKWQVFNINNMYSLCISKICKITKYINIVLQVQDKAC